jgi:hypothetical protein
VNLAPGLTMTKMANGLIQFLHDENSLLKEIRATVKSVYFDMTIENIIEIQSFEGANYFITLQDKSNIKVIKINQYYPKENHRN